MSKKVGSFILPDDIIKGMKSKIKETSKKKIELGFSLCTKNSVLTKGTECIGTQCSIKVGECPESTYVGNYHTHPRGIATLSITDMVTGCDEEIECVGSAPSNNIRCFTRKTDKALCFSEISPFEEDEHKIIERGQEIRKTLRSPMFIIKTGIRKIAKDIYQYDSDITKYHINRLKLLNKNFDRTDI